MASTGRECLKFSQFEFSLLIKITLCDHCNYIDHNYGLSLLVYIP